MAAHASRVLLATLVKTVDGMTDGDARALDAVKRGGVFVGLGPAFFFSKRKTKKRRRRRKKKKKTSEGAVLGNHVAVSSRGPSGDRTRDPF